MLVVMDVQSDCAVKTAKKQRGKPFVKGKSGNPNGRPKGSRNKTTMATLELLGEEAEAITKMAIKRAKKGDMAAIKLVMDRICPPRKDMPITFDIESIQTLDGVILALDQLLQSVCNAEVSPQEAQAIAALIEQQRKTIISSIPYMTFVDF